MAPGRYHSPETVIDFGTRFYGELNRIVGNRMRKLGVPEVMIGIRNYFGLDDGPFVRFPASQIGGNVNAFIMQGSLAGIALDHGIFDSGHPRMNSVATWARAAVRERMDAVIVHEYLEATLRPPARLMGQAGLDWLHNEAIRRAPDTTMPITAGARRILTDYRRALGLGQ